jgi:Tol biopolymer transport system component
MRAFATAVLLTIALPAAAPAASFPPSLRFRTIKTPQALVHYPRGLEAQARKAAALATQILGAHEARYGVSVRPVHVVLADVSDDPNGFALPFPYPLVHIRAVPPDGSDEFGNYDDWLRLVLTHELAHIVHLEETRGVLGFGRKLFGRAPFLFPNSLTPSWLIEGLATYEETEGTAFGRGRNPDSRMVLRMAALGGRFPSEDRASLGLDAWPGGLAPYLMGEAFVRDLETRFGKQTLPQIARVHAGRIIPYTDDWTAHTVTGATFHASWREWKDQWLASAAAEAEGIKTRGVTSSRAITRLGVRQSGPRFSPDGRWIAYTSRTLTRFSAIRLVRPDGNEDHELVRRNSGTSLSWTPDGKAIVFDESEVFELFSTFSDLRLVDVASGRVRRLTRGMRGRDPDVAPDGRTLVLVRESGGTSELATLGLDAQGLRVLTSSAPGTEWSGPRWSPRGDAIVASRWLAGGFLDIVRVDPVTGAVKALTQDRAKDVEPAWTPDGALVVFRSDRDGVSNLHALRLEGGDLVKLTNVVGGAFTPDVAPDGREIAFADYGAGGYDVHVTAFDPEAHEREPDFEDAYPAARPAPDPVTAADTAYHPLPALLPRFWSPYVSFGSETQAGVVSAGFDPLFRHAYGVDVHRGFDTDRFGFHGLYQYDRFRPTFLVTAEDVYDPEAFGALLRTQELTLRATLPVARTLRHAQSVSLTWRGRRETLSGSAEDSRLDLGGLEAAYSLSSAKQFPFSIGPVEGWRLRLAWLREAEALGSDVSLSKATGDLRAYTRVFGATDALALRLGGGTSFGRPAFKQSFAIGGFPDASLLDVVRTNVSVLRGYPDNAFRGRNFVAANVEYRVPLAHPQRGWASFPLFVRHVHAAAFFDAGHAWSDGFRVKDVKTGAGVGLGVDMLIGHRLPLTGVVGVARGFADKGETSVYFRTGFAF